MAYGNAGRYGPEAVLYDTGGGVPSLLRSVAITVKNVSDGSVATLYTDRTATTTAANPVSTDGAGNLSFFAAPGAYTLNYTTLAGAVSLPITVQLDPADKTPDVFGVNAYAPVGRPAWATGVSYVVGQDVMSPTNEPVVCLVAHTSGTVYATDRAAGKWAQNSALYPAKVVAPTGVAATDTAALQAAHDALPSQGGWLILQPGDYAINDTGLVINKPVRITGAGVGKPSAAATRLVSASLTGYAITVNADGVILQDFALINTATATAGAGVYLTRGAFSHLRGLLISGFYDGIRYDQGYYYTISECTVLDPVRYGMYLRNTTQTDHGDQLVSGCTITPYNSTANPTAGIHWESGGGLKLIGNKINSNGPQPDGNASAGKFATGIECLVADGVSTSVIAIEGNSVEGWSSAGIVVGLAGASGSATGTLNKVIIIGNEVAASGSGTAIAVNPNTLGKTNNVLVGNNVISNAGTGLLFQNIDTLYVAPNTMRVVGGVLSMLAGITDEQIEPQVVTGDSLVLYSTGSLNNTGTRVAMNQHTLSYARETPSTTSTSTYTTLYRISMPSFSAAMLDFTFGGNINGKGATLYTARRSLTRGNGGNVTANVQGTDQFDGFAGTATAPFDLLFDTTTVAGECQVKIRLNATQGGTDIVGRVRMTLDGIVTSVRKGS